MSDERKPAPLTPEEYIAMLRANPRFREAPKSGRGYIIGGVRSPPSKDDPTPNPADDE